MGVKIGKELCPVLGHTDGWVSICGAFSFHRNLLLFNASQNRYNLKQSYSIIKLE